MIIVYLPASWVRNMPKGAKPYVNRAVCAAEHPAEKVTQTPYLGPDDDQHLNRSTPPASLVSSVPASQAAPVPSVEAKKSSNKVSKSKTQVSK